MPILPLILAAVPAPAPLWEMVPPVADYAAPCPLPAAKWGTKLSTAPVQPASNDVHFGADGQMMWNGFRIDDSTLRRYMAKVITFDPRPTIRLYSAGASCAELRRVAALIDAAGPCTPYDCIVLPGSRPTPPPYVVAPPAPPSVSSYPPAPPAPPPPGSKPSPRGSPQSWVTNEDYPAAAIRAHAQGTTGFTLSLDAGGNVVGCTVTASSGSALLDDTTCRLLSERAKFNPARTADGTAIAARWASRFRWELPAGSVPIPPTPRLSWTHIRQFTIGTDGVISGCSDEYFGTPAERKEDYCRNIDLMPPAFRNAMRGNSKGPVTIQMRYQHSVEGVALDPAPRIPSGFRQVMMSRETFQISETGEMSNCRPYNVPTLRPTDTSNCTYIGSYAAGPRAVSVTITESLSTTGDPNILPALRKLEE